MTTVERAIAIADSVKRPPVALVIEKMAASHAVRLVEHRFSGPVRGAALGGDTVVLDARLHGFARQWVFAHELGHILAQRCEMADAGGELFADSFARHYLLPLSWADAGSNAPLSLARRLGLRGWLVAVQLSVLGEMPRVLRQGREVLCSSCGIRGHDPFCACAEARRSPAARWLLPSVREMWTESAPSFASETRSLWNDCTCDAGRSANTVEWLC